MDDLVEWLRQQLDEDERVARTAGADLGESAFGADDRLRFQDALLRWEARRWLGSRRVVADTPTAVRITEDALGPVSEHIACWDPARVLREVEAKRRLLDWLLRLDDQAIDNNWWSLEVEDAVKLLALPYSDRSGYREEWRP